MDEGPEKRNTTLLCRYKKIPELFKKFKIEYLSQVQDIIQKKDGKIQTYWHYLLLIRKESDKN